MPKVQCYIRWSGIQGLRKSQKKSQKEAARKEINKGKQQIIMFVNQV